MDSPLVTILMPVYNAEKYLNRAIDSILSQSYNNIEFLVINDGSTDNSLNIIRSYKDERIVLVENDKNRGLIYSLNIGIEIAKGKYIARMDADDISFQDRIQKQCNFLEKNITVGILGTLIEGETKFKVYADQKLNSNELKARIIFNNIFNHPTIMFRSSFLKEKNINYNSEYPHAEDYNLWLTALNDTEFAILIEPLLYYENHQDQVSYIYDQEQRTSILKTQQKFLRSINLEFNDDEMEIHRKLFYQNYIYDLNFLIAAEKWLIKIRDNRGFQAIVTKEALEKTTSVMWFELCTDFTSKGIKTTKLFHRSTLCITENISIYYRSVFEFKNLRAK
jgi:glycosyltransferase involved in cell wall biosynthesis